jgi:hypothetical protein
MIPKQLIQTAVAAALIAAASGQLPKFVHSMRVAQYKVLMESQASRWPKGLLLTPGPTQFRSPVYQK